MFRDHSCTSPAVFHDLMFCVLIYQVHAVSFTFYSCFQMTVGVCIFCIVLNFLFCSCFIKEKDYCQNQACVLLSVCTG